jgi:hypothetical protein
MKRDALPRLGIPLLAALLLHGLGLSLSHLQSSRRPPPAKLSARDDTAELLVLSRGLAEEPAMEAIPLPPRLSLPPPPPPPALLPEAGTASPKKAAPRVVPPRRLPGAARAKTPGAKPPSEATKPRPPDPGTAGPLAVLRSLREQASQPASEETETTTDSAGNSPPLLRPAGESVDAWRKLWETARPESTPGKELGDLPASVEVRRLPLTQTQGAGVIATHGQAVVLADHLILLWIENGTLWLLRSPTTPG